MTDSKAVRAVIYARVSTLDQDPEVQVRELREWVARRGWTLVATHVDHGVSGSKDRRPELDKLMAAVRKRTVDVVVVWSLCRLGRSLSHLVRTCETFSSLGVDFACMTQPIDTTSPAGRLTFAVLGAVAQFEKDMTVMRVRAGLAKARALGKHIGRPKSTIDPEQVRVLREGGMSLREIADRVGGSKSAVARLIAG